MTKINERLGAEGITYYELVAAGFHSLRELTITEVTKESSCAFGILSAFRKELLAKGQVPLFTFTSEGSLYNFEDPDLEGHLQYIFKYICQYEHTPKGTEVTTKERQYAKRLNKLLPEGIALINIWDFAINKMVHNFITSLQGLLYNSHAWLFLDMDQDLQSLDKPPYIPQDRDQSILMKMHPRLQYLLRSSRMCESKCGTRKDVCTIFAKHNDTSNDKFKPKVTNFEAKVKQTAKHVIGVYSFIEQKVESLSFNNSGISDESSNRLYQKFQQVIYETPYEDVPLSWIFLRSLFYRSDKKFIAKSELRKKAEECCMDDESLTKFCEFYTSFGSIFDLSLINPHYPYVIVKPMGFLRTLNMLLYPEDSICQKYPSIVNGIIPEKACKDVFGESWLVFMEALVSVNLGTRVSSSHLDIPDLDPNDIYYFIPLSRKGNLIMEADPTAVHLIINIDAPHVFQQTTFTNYLLRSLQKPMLVQCDNPNQTIITETATGVTVTLVSHSPATEISISQANPDVCSLILKVYGKIAEGCKIGTIKYKFVMICAKSGVPDAQYIPSCQYHILPDDGLCDECKKAGRVNDQLKSWNKALREVGNIAYNLIFIHFYFNFSILIYNGYQSRVSIIFLVIDNECVSLSLIELKPSELSYIAEQIASCDPTVVAKTLGLAIDMPRFEGFKGEKLIIEMLLAWDKDFTKRSQAEPKRELARKLLELGSELPQQKIDFENLARELDIYGIQLT